MEIEGSNGSKTQLKPYSTTIFGRQNGFHPNDLAVSRRHISIDFNPSQTNPRVSFEVLGKNPLWVFENKDSAKIIAFKRFQRGELGVGDMFCLSPRDPVWFTVKKLDDEKEREREEIEGTVNDELSQSLEISYEFNDNGEFGLDSVDVSSIDPIQEFGFLVIGHEFDRDPKQMIRDVKSWNWFLEDLRRDSDDEEEKRGRRGGKRKKTKGDADADEEWTGGSDNEEIVTTKARKVQTPTYQTRSKDKGKSKKERKDRKAYAKSSSKEEEEEEGDEEDEEDETLGGFIVEDESVKGEKDVEEEDEEEEEFVEDEDEDEEELDD